MSSEFQIVFHKIDQSDAIVENVNKRIAKLERYSNDIMGGRVVLDSPHNHHHKGKVYSVTLEVHTPYKEIVVTQDQQDNHAHEDLYVVIRDAFNAAERQLKSLNKKRRKPIPDFRQAQDAIDESLGEPVDAEYRDENEDDEAGYIPATG